MDIVVTTVPPPLPIQSFTPISSLTADLLITHPYVGCVVEDQTLESCCALSPRLSPRIQDVPLLKNSTVNCVKQIQTGNESRPRIKQAIII